MKRALIILAILAAVTAAAVFAWRIRSHTPEDRIAISGNIELTDVNLAFKTSGRLVELAVKEGDAVKKGMLLARVDSEQLSLQRERERAGVRAAESQLQQLRTGIAWQRETLEADIAQKQAQVREAQARLQELEAGARPQDIQQARAAVDAARTESDRAARDWERAQTLFKNDDISAQQHDQFRARAESAAAALKQAQERLALVLEGARKEDIQAARAQVQRAQAAVKMSEATRLELKRREEETAGRQAEIARARAQTSIVESQLADTQLVSPIDGVVLVKSAELGEIVAPGTAVLTVGDIDHPWLRGYIGEPDLGRVKIGGKAKVTTDSFPGKTYWGRISFIASEAEFTPKQIQTKGERVKLVYRIKIDVENPQRELKNNMPADAELLLGQ